MKIRILKLSISDTDDRGILTFDLKDILSLLGDKGLVSSWVLTEVEVVDGPTAQHLHNLCDSGHSVSGWELRDLSEKISQTIDGEFSAYLPGATEPWIHIRAIDSASFDVRTVDQEVYNRIKSTFSAAVDLSDVDDA